MNVEQERSRSLWMEVPPQRFAALSGNAEADVLVIGGGIAGLSVAYELAREGRQVTVIDRGHIARGMTARTTAHLTYASDDYFRVLGEVRGRAWFESQSAAVDRIEEICREEDIACDFARVDGLLMPASEKDLAGMRDELEAAHACGFKTIRWLSDAQVFGVAGPAMFYPNQARFHPLKYLAGLTAAIEARGGRLFEETALKTLKEEGGKVIVETTAGSTITARQAVIATNSPAHVKLPLHTKQAPYRTYVIAAPVPKDSVRDILLWDTQEPGYHYVRLQPGEREDMLIVGGEDHKTGTKDDGDRRIQTLEDWARARFPQMGAVTYAWSGQVYEPADHVGFIGRSPGDELTFVVTGDSGQGITTGVAASLILRDLVAGRENPWAHLYRPDRLMTHGLGAYVKEGLGAARHLAELVTARETPSLEAILPGEGAIARIDGKAVAAYRDQDGELTLRSAACSHAGCVVHWNGFEACWDCPCHGSQFSIEGEVLNGPAVAPLRELAPPKETGPGEQLTESRLRP